MAIKGIEEKDLILTSKDLDGIIGVIKILKGSKKKKQKFFKGLGEFSKLINGNNNNRSSKDSVL